MSDVVIRTENLGKCYLIGHQKSDRNAGVREALAESIFNFARKIKLASTRGQLIRGDEIEEFWALKEVNFEVKRGEIVGIIGRNGAGKSTLLKLLSRITEPSAGRIELKGRVASLLEVGTGFHPELSGRENIYLNGSILGMTRAEIRRKFDEIVAFAGVERFLDTPVKRYSSGMYVRLAFSIAAHLEPDILIIDEVLAVGDSEFQRRCLGKMEDVSSSGRTVLIVSHNINIVRELSQKALLLSNGNLVEFGAVSEVVQTYVGQTNSHKKSAEIIRKDFRADISIENAANESVFEKNEAISIRIDVEAKTDIRNLHAGYAIYQSGGVTPLWWSFFGDVSGKIGVRKGRTTFRSEIPDLYLNDGEYVLEMLVAEHGAGWVTVPNQREAVMSFRVEGGIMGSVLVSGTKRPGMMFPLFPWTTEITTRV